MGNAGSQPQVVVNNIGVQPGQGIDVPPKNKWVAFLLCLLLGYLGAHYFYVGKIGMGHSFTSSPSGWSESAG